MGYRRIMKDCDCVAFLQWALPRLRMRWPGFRKVRKQVCKRIDRRIQRLGLTGVAAYRSYLDAHDAEWSVLDGFCRISISRFYRDWGVFNYLRDDILPELAQSLQTGGNHTLHCWSAGCASGEEVYTLTIIWRLGVQPQFPSVDLRIIATDADPNMLERARRGCHATSSLKDFPADWLPIAFTESNDLFSVKPDFRKGVDFVLQDIRSEMPAGKFDLVLCRHLAFTYFDEPLQQRILSQIVAKLLPGGVLVTGKQEALPTRPVEFEECRPHSGIYRKLNEF
jgi:chemotaxis protein methyltransferase CheR